MESTESRSYVMAAWDSSDQSGGDVLNALQTVEVTFRQAIDERVT